MVRPSNPVCTCIPVYANISLGSKKPVAHARLWGWCRDMDASELQEQDSVLCCAAAPVTAMQFQPRRDGLLVRSPSAVNCTWYIMIPSMLWAAFVAAWSAS